MCFFKKLLTVVLLSALMGLPLQATASQLLPLADDHLQLKINPRLGAVQQWQLPGVLDAEKGWHDLAGSSAQWLHIDGTLAGRTLDEWQQMAAGWAVIRKQANQVTLELSHESMPLTIRQDWQLTSEPGRVVLRLQLLARKGSALSHSDELWFSVGPGLGEIPAQGLGMGQSIYSFTELIMLRDGKVDTRRLNQELRTVVSSKEPPVQALGLQSRYFAWLIFFAAEQGHSWQARLPNSPAISPERPEFGTSLRIDLPLPVTEKEVKAFNFQLFGGAKAYEVLTAGKPALDGLLFSGLWSWIRWLPLGIMHLLNLLHDLVGSWGIAIILLAVLVRLVMHPVAKNAMTAQKKFIAVQKKIQPELNAIKKEFKGGEQSERILQLYERHKVSPLAGLKPLLIVLVQLPIFISLYHLLGQAFELRTAAFLWMDTLAEPDQLFPFGVDLPFFGSYFNLLPVLMSVSTLLSIKLSPAPAADAKASFRQNIMLGLMTLGFFLLFYSFPSGMVLYWTMANLLHLAYGLWFREKSADLGCTQSENIVADEISKGE